MDWREWEIWSAIFFVISGFVIPYSLFKANYELKHYFKFLYKRVLRLHPPYLAALLIILKVPVAVKV
ncbi:acyltransferase family protein [Mucilaginibacter sp.]